jgi:lipoate-protein ligase A
MHPHNFYIDDLVLDRMVQGSKYVCEIYEAHRVEVVLGRSSTIEEDVNMETCADDEVPLSRRRGGGGTVVLSPGTVILSIAGRSKLQYHLREHMNAVNRIIVDTLEKLGVDSPAIRGISDIALGMKKILGSSLYRRKDLILYQGSLLVNPDLSLIKRYLKQPRKQPAYRKDRSHEDFVTSLHNEGYDTTVDEIVETLREAFYRLLPWPPVLPGQEPV